MNPPSADRGLKADGPSVLFSGSPRFPSSAPSSMRSRPSHAIGVVSLAHTRVAAAGPDPEVHSERCSTPNGSVQKLWRTSHRLPDRELLQPDDEVVQELRDDAAGEGLGGLPLRPATVARSPSISTRRRPETSATESSSASSGDRCPDSLRVRDDLTQGSRTSSPRRSTRSVVRGRNRCAARAGGRSRSRRS